MGLYAIYNGIVILFRPRGHAVPIVHCPMASCMAFSLLSAHFLLLHTEQALWSHTPFRPLISCLSSVWLPFGDGASHGTRTMCPMAMLLVVVVIGPWSCVNPSLRLHPHTVGFSASIPCIECDCLVPLLGGNFLPNLLHKPPFPSSHASAMHQNSSFCGNCTPQLWPFRPLAPACLPCHGAAHMLSTSPNGAPLVSTTPNGPHLTPPALRRIPSRLRRCGGPWLPS